MSDGLPGGGLGGTFVGYGQRETEQTSDMAQKIEWYLARDGQQHGPLTEAELNKFIELGHLRPTDLLWRAGFADWRVASDVFPLSEPRSPVRASSQPASEEPDLAADPVEDETVVVSSRQPEPEPESLPEPAPALAAKAAPAGSQSAPNTEPEPQAQPAPQPKVDPEPGPSVAVAAAPRAERDARPTEPARESGAGAPQTAGGEVRPATAPGPRPAESRPQVRLQQRIAPEQAADPQSAPRAAAPSDTTQPARPRPAPNRSPADTASAVAAPSDDTGNVAQTAAAAWQAAETAARSRAPAPQPTAEAAGPRGPVQPSHGYAGPRPALPGHPALQGSPAAAGPGVGPRLSDRLPHPSELQPPGRIATTPATPEAFRQPPFGPAHDPKQPRFGAAFDSETDVADYPEQETGGRSRRSGFLMGGLVVVLLAFLGAGGWYASQHPEEIQSIYESAIGGASLATAPVVRAPTEVVRERAGDVVAPAPALQRHAAAPAAIAPVSSSARPNVALLNSPLWQLMGQRFPAWVEKRDEEVRELQANGKSPADINKHLVQQFVAFRRSNAAVALSAPIESLEAIVQAFVANLRALSGVNDKMCFAFISRGEVGEEIVPLFADPVGSQRLQNQSQSIVNAIVAAQDRAARYDPPVPEDFDALSVELRKRGWSQQDLAMFSDPAQLSKAPPATVCRLVTDWFVTQSAIEDADRRARLIAASLRPVVAE